jgi:hypothetical protein
VCKSEQLTPCATGLTLTVEAQFEGAFLPAVSDNALLLADRAFQALGKAYRFGRWRAGIGIDRPAEKAQIARQATEWANEKGLEKSGLENSAAPGAMDALTTACRTLHSNRDPPQGKRE